MCVLPFDDVALPGFALFTLTLLTSLHGADFTRRGRTDGQRIL
jgi:hypothetical protein